MRNRRRLIVATALAVVVALIAGLILTSGKGPATKPAASVKVLSPFTGEQVAALREVLAVKIDNVAQARPPTGLGRADIVYVLPVEGGLTRLLAIFSSDPPPWSARSAARAKPISSCSPSARPPYATTTGSGDALVLRDGQAFDARWSRPAADGGTTFTTGSGQPMTFAPGPVWLVLVPAIAR